MAIKTEGSLSLSEINAEFGLGTNLGAYRGVTGYTSGGTAVVLSSTNLDFAEFYGLDKDAPTIVVGLRYSDCNGGYIGCGATLNVGINYSYFAACHDVISGHTYTYAWTEFDVNAIVMNPQDQQICGIKHELFATGTYPIRVTVTDTTTGAVGVCNNNVQCV